VTLGNLLTSVSVSPSHITWYRLRGGVVSNGAGKVQGASEFQANIFLKISFPVSVKIRISVYQTVECFIATLSTYVYILVIQSYHLFCGNI